ncbi:hypothetical protein MRX96_033248 [Rhipicephalus microplus]
MAFRPSPNNAKSKSENEVASLQPPPSPSALRPETTVFFDDILCFVAGAVGARDFVHLLSKACPVSGTAASCALSRSAEEQLRTLARGARRRHNSPCFEPPR